MHGLSPRAALPPQQPSLGVPGPQHPGGVQQTMASAMLRRAVASAPATQGAATCSAWLSRQATSLAGTASTSAASVSVGQWVGRAGSPPLARSALCQHNARQALTERRAVPPSSDALGVQAGLRSLHPGAPAGERGAAAARVFTAGDGPAVGRARDSAPGPCLLAGCGKQASDGPSMHACCPPPPPLRSWPLG